MQRDKRAENLKKNERVYFANKTLVVKEVNPFIEGGLRKVRVSFKGFRDVEFNADQLVTIFE